MKVYKDQTQSAQEDCLSYLLLLCAIIGLVLGLFGCPNEFMNGTELGAIFAARE